MATTGSATTLTQRSSARLVQSHEVTSPGENPADAGSEDLRRWRKHVERVKAEILKQVQGQLSDLLDEALSESVQSFAQRERERERELPAPPDGQNTSRTQRMKEGKVFMERRSILDELFEINHIRTIYHMFIAALVLFILSTLAVDYIDQGRLVLEFDLLFYAFGKMPTVLWAWLLMFGCTLVVPYHVLGLWGAWYHRCPSRLALSLGTGLALAGLQAAALGVFPVYTAVHYQLPPASRFIVIVEQIRFIMKSYSFIRENVPVILKSKPEPGEVPRFPTFSSYLYFLFCPTLIYRESYPRNAHIRWKYVGVTFAKGISCILYVHFILVRLCIPVFRNENNEPFSTRTLVLAVFNATLPGMLILLMAFFAFLHCWLNTFAEMLRFADRMFYKDWWNSYSFAGYYRTWNVVVHDWLYDYGYRDFLWLSGRRFRTAGMLSVFIVSAVVHEYVMTISFGFFYPVLFFLFTVFGVMFNFMLNDKRKSPISNIIMWTSLFIGQGVQLCLYCQEWYAQIRCPRAGDGFWELVTPRSWSCSY